MFIIDCLPFKKGLNKESLSYFSATYLEPGSLIKINIRNKNESALVIESRDAREAKSEIKSVNFQLKKVVSLNARPFLQKSFLEGVTETANYFATTPGNVLTHLIPSFILKNPNLLEARAVLKMPQTQRTVLETSILQASDEERFDHYKSLIREEFAKNKSVFLVLPQNEMIIQAQKKLERGIEPFVLAFHQNINQKELKERWKKASLSKHPVLIIATTKWLFLPREDFGTIIIDKENDTGWKTLVQPFIDLRFFVETLAKQKNINLIIGDVFLRIETLYRYKNIKWHQTSSIKTQVVDMKEVNQKKKEFKILGDEVLQLIKKTLTNKSHIFLFAARKGLSPLTICRDCGLQVKCFNCDRGMILYKIKGKTAFVCNQCGETRDAQENCQNCKSWKLMAMGVGIDKIADEIKKYFPDIPLFEVHKDITKTSIQVEKMVAKFYETKGSVLLGTEMVFPYLNKKVSASAIASFDSLFAIPDFRIKEKIFRLIIQTKNLAKENFLIQSRNVDDSTIQSAIALDLMSFYKQEMADRKILSYPPYGIFIKITARGTHHLVTKETQKLKKIFENPKNQLDFKTTIFNSLQEKKGAQIAVNAVIKILPNNWPNQKLLSILKSLPSHFEIKVDPDSLL